jgi:predicted transcriptional regulator
MAIKGLASFLKNRKRSYGQILGKLEKEIMNLLWSRGEATGRKVLDELRHSREIAFTTVLTVMERLVKKGLVEKRRGESVYIYKPRYTREEFGRLVSDEVLKGVLELSASSAVASIVDLLVEANPKELERLSRLIEAKRQEMEKIKGLKIQTSG